MYQQDIELDPFSTPKQTSEDESELGCSNILNSNVKDYNVKPNEKNIQNDETSSWRLDTANNYTSDLEYWRSQYGSSQERHYYFNITELVEVDNANGVVRNLTVINGQYPGPLIEANSGDTIFLHVSNQMDDNPVSFHMHGLFYRNNSFDDGASSISVCPIPPGGNYTYRVPIGTDEMGTYWYHSHWSTQYADGVFGPLVIHSPDEDKRLDFYDSDRVYVVNDYYHDNAHTYLADYLAPGNENAEPSPQGGIIDGSYSQSPGFLSQQSDPYLAALYFDPEATYRLRILNAGFFVPFKFSIDQHKFTMVEVEGTLIEPFETDYIDVSVGERYSMFITRNGTEDNYWAHARFNQFCLADDASDFSKDVMSIVSYSGAYEIPTSKETWQYDGGSPKCLDFPTSELKTLNGVVPKVANGSIKPDMAIDLDVTFFQKGYQLTRGYFNEYTWRSLSNTSTMHELLFNKEFSSNSYEYNTPTFYQDQYVLNLDERGMIVDFLVNNYDDGSHPFHLHGYKFWVLANGSGSFYREFYDKHPDRLNFKSPILRDTVSVAPFGYAVLRFVVDNPGVFPFHCHIGWHIEAGLLLQVNALQSEWSKHEYNPSWATMCGYDFSDPY
ncbi:hypothetical protein DAMA08_028460 [Martiniozyma asiatica (nom. inval.)]|nr:hypothetical protein DAMA08_028460 [Martiniozyma asiatica]